jgi:hypothetical protein
MIRDGELLIACGVDELGLASMRGVQVRREAPTAPERDRVPGIGPISVDGHEHRFTVTGSPAAPITALAELHVEDLTMTPPSLEDAVRTLHVPTPQGHAD